MVTIPIFRYLYNGNSSITTYSVKHPFSLADATDHLKHCYVTGIKDKSEICWPTKKLAAQNLLIFLR